MIAPALIASLCQPPAVMAEQLADRYGEAPVAAGLSSSGHALQLWAQPSGESWTLLLILPSGQACILDAGSALEVTRPGAPA